MIRMMMKLRQLEDEDQDDCEHNQRFPLRRVAAVRQRVQAPLQPVDHLWVFVFCLELDFCIISVATSSTSARDRCSLQARHSQIDSPTYWGLYHENDLLKRITSSCWRCSSFFWSPESFNKQTNCEEGTHRRNLTRFTGYWKKGWHRASWTNLVVNTLIPRPSLLRSCVDKNLYQAKPWLRRSSQVLLDPGIWDTNRQTSSKKAKF